MDVSGTWFAWPTFIEGKVPAAKRLVGPEVAPQV